MLLLFIMVYKLEAPSKIILKDIVFSIKFGLNVSVFLCYEKKVTAFNVKGN